MNEVSKEVYCLNPGSARWNSKLTIDVSLKLIATHLKGLTSLDLSECSELTDDSVLAIIPPLKGLTSLNLSRCYSLQMPQD